MAKEPCQSFEIGTALFLSWRGDGSRPVSTLSPRTGVLSGVTPQNHNVEAACMPSHVAAAISDRGGRRVATRLYIAAPDGRFFLGVTPQNHNVEAVSYRLTSRWEISDRGGRRVATRLYSVATNGRSFGGNASKPQCRGGMHAVSDLCEKFPTEAGDGSRPVSTLSPQGCNNS